MAGNSNSFGFAWVLERFTSLRGSGPGPVVITPEKLETAISENTARAFIGNGQAPTPNPTHAISESTVRAFTGHRGNETNQKAARSGRFIPPPQPPM